MKGGIDSGTIEIEMDGNKVNVYRSLKNAIQFLRLKPGMAITEAALKEVLNVGRTPIREALIRLGDEQLVDIFPQRGTYISKINLQIAREMAYMRHIIETEIFIDLAASRKDLKEVVQESLFFMKQAITKNDTVSYVKADAMFHKAIFINSGHGPIWNVIANTRAHYVRFLMLDMNYPDTLASSYDQHLDIVNFIAEGNPEKLNRLLEVHHDHKYLEQSDDIIAKFPEYIQ